MKVDVVKYSPAFKSGYPTFGTGHLGIKEIPNNSIYDNVYIGFKPQPDEQRGGLLNYLA